jgi:hypothetical protein
MTAPISRTTPNAPQTRTEEAPPDFSAPAPSLDPNFKAADHLRADGSLNIDATVMPPGYEGFVQSFGETHSASIMKRAETKMGEWVKNNPNATNEQFTNELKKQLQLQSLVQNELKNSIQKFQNDLFNKMKEMASDRFG